METVKKFKEQQKQTIKEVVKWKRLKNLRNSRNRQYLY
jgi:hypothetical protein